MMNEHIDLAKYFYNEGRQDMRRALREMITFDDPFHYQELIKYYLSGQTNGGIIIKSYRQGLQDILKERMTYAN